MYIISRYGIELFRIGDIKKKYYNHYVAMYGLQYAKDMKFICWKLKDKDSHSMKNKNYWKHKLLWANSIIISDFEKRKGYQVTFAQTLL